MAILETKHTMSRINRIKSDLLKVLSVISCISMMFFLTYYVYLVSKNLYEKVYLVTYSILILVIILLFVVEFLVKEDKKLLKTERRLIAEKKRRSKNIIKLVKFLVKAFLVIIAMYETFTNFSLSLSNIFNIFSLVLLVLQIIFEFAIRYIIKQIDYFRLSMELDLEASSILVKKIMKKLNPMKSLEDDVVELNNVKKYSNQEEKFIKDIKLETAKYCIDRDEKQRELKEMIVVPRTKKIILDIGKIFKRK